MSDSGKKRALGPGERVVAGAVGAVGVVGGVLLMPLSPIGFVGGSAIAGGGARLVHSAITGKDETD